MFSIMPIAMPSTLLSESQVAKLVTGEKLVFRVENERIHGLTTMECYIAAFRTHDPCNPAINKFIAAASVPNSTVQCMICRVNR